MTAYDPKKAAQQFSDRQAADAGGLFAELMAGPPLASRFDAPTSKDAAEQIAEVLSDLQQRVYDAVKRHGAMSGPEAEALPEFADCKPSTVRHRLTDLERKGLLVVIGKRAGCGVYELAGRAQRQGEAA